MPIGGDGKDATINRCRRLSIQQATVAQIDTRINQTLNQLISEGVTGTVSAGDESSIKNVLTGNSQDGAPISLGRF